MVPLPITEDYYLILEVMENATPEVITKSYRRLALKLHPDRNSATNATEVFQRVRGPFGASIASVSMHIDMNLKAWTCIRDIE